MARKYSKKPGDLGKLRAVLWQTIVEIEALLISEDCPPERLLRAGHCLSQLAGAYRAVMEAHDLETRLLRLEALTNGGGHP